MIRRPPRSTLDRSSAASDVYKRQVHHRTTPGRPGQGAERQHTAQAGQAAAAQEVHQNGFNLVISCLLYTSDAADERSSVDLGGRRIIKKKNSDEIE